MKRNRLLVLGLLAILLIGLGITAWAVWGDSIIFGDAVVTAANAVPSLDKSATTTAPIVSQSVINTPPLFFIVGLANTNITYIDKACIHTILS